MSARSDLHIRRKAYLSAWPAQDGTTADGGETPPPGAALVVEETGPGDRHVRLRTETLGVTLDAEATERLGIDLQIRASYLRGYRRPIPEETP